jgi:hypothetical protein
MKVSWTTLLEKRKKKENQCLDAHLHLLSLKKKGTPISKIYRRNKN